MPEYWDNTNPTLEQVLLELRKYGDLRKQFNQTQDWQLRKAMVMQETVFLIKAVEFYETNLEPKEQNDHSP